MTTELISQILTVLSTMRGYPPMPPLASDDQPMDPVRASYASLLVRMPDSLGTKLRNGVLMRFDERPSVKNLADWSASLGPAPAFDIKQLDHTAVNSVDHTAVKPAYRPGGMTAPGLLLLGAAGSAGKAAVAAKTPIPDSAKAIFRRLRERDQADWGRHPVGPAVTGDWGLMHIFEDGRTERCPAIHSEAEARRRQDELCRKYSHFSCRIYQRVLIESVIAPKEAACP